MKKEIPQPFAIDEIRCRNCFSDPSYRIFAALMIGWALTVGKHTMSQVILTMRLDESRHFAAIYRFLRKGQWWTDWVSYCLFRVLVEILVAEGYNLHSARPSSPRAAFFRVGYERACSDGVLSTDPGLSARCGIRPGS
jgi:hypothetical protein